MSAHLKTFLHKDVAHYGHKVLSTFNLPKNQDYFVFHEGVLSSTYGIETIAFLSTKPDLQKLGWPNLEVHFCDILPGKEHMVNSGYSEKVSFTSSHSCTCTIYNYLYMCACVHAGAGMCTCVMSVFMYM